MLSVIVITKNEEDRIKVCLESVQWADEIIVADNGSTDKTLQIVKKYTDKILHLTDNDFSILRNKAAEKAAGDWLLYIDADERVLKPLKEEIMTLIYANSNFSAFAISRRNIIFGKEVKYSSFWPDWVIRLLKKDDFDTWFGKVHEYPKFKGKLGYLKSSFLHLTHRDLDQIVYKSLEWSKIDAMLRLDSNHPKMSGLRFLRIFITETFNQGILKRGFLNGSVGVMDSLLQVFSMLMSYTRLWQMQQPKKIQDIYRQIDEELVKSGFIYK